MRKLLVPIAVAIVMSTGVASADQPSAAMPAHGDAMCTSQAMELRSGMRKLWEDHITYTRNYIISALGRLPDQKPVLERLLKNQDDIGTAIKPFYGNDAGDKLTALLRDHIVIAGDVVKA